MVKQLLIVDDQPGIRTLLKELFSKDGFETREAASGDEALKQIREKRPDLVILDVKIPDMDGIDILKEIKQYDKTIKVIMMTAYGELNVMNEVVREGAADYFLKPFDIHDIRSLVKNQLR